MLRQTAISTLLGLCLVCIVGTSLAQQTNEDEEAASRPNPEELGGRRAVPADLQDKALKIDPTGPVAASGSEKAGIIIENKPVTEATGAAPENLQRKALKIEPAGNQAIGELEAQPGENPAEATPPELEVPSGEDKDLSGG
jgi:hypothetical protein